MPKSESADGIRSQEESAPLGNGSSKAEISGCPIILNAEQDSLIDVQNLSFIIEGYDLNNVMLSEVVLEEVEEDLKMNSQEL
ncbi:hypothetical protein J6590_093626 [Homalodisca vitripennis]|nr:hypothetical protein J6590_093626 [Homalodisca vitripennis]